METNTERLADRAEVARFSRTERESRAHERRRVLLLLRGASRPPRLDQHHSWPQEPSTAGVAGGLLRLNRRRRRRGDCRAWPSARRSLRGSVRAPVALLAPAFACDRRACLENVLQLVCPCARRDAAWADGRRSEVTTPHAGVTRPRRNAAVDA